MRSASNLFFIGLLACGAASCNGVKAPPVTNAPTGSHDTGRFVWLDLVTEDVEAVKQFYAGLFGWTFRPITDDETYTLILKDDEPMGGILFSDRVNDVSESRWVSYLSVLNVDRAVRVARERVSE